MRKPKLRGAAVATLAGLALAAGGGGAIAATQSGGDREAFLADVAERLGVQQTELESALKEASIARVDAAVEAGRLTEEQAARIKERIEAGGGPLVGGFGGPPPHGPHVEPRAVHEAAATYLGMTERQLRAAHRSGTSLADLAKERGKSVGGLKEAMTAAAESALDQAVSAGRLTTEGRESLADGLSERIDDWVEGTRPGPRMGRHRAHGPHAGAGPFVPGPLGARL